MKKLLVIATLFAAMAGVAWSQQTVDQRGAASRDGIVEIENIAGSVVVIGWDRAEVEVTGTIPRRYSRLEFETEGDRTRIEIDVDDDEDFGESHLEIRVPRDSQLEIETVSASIEVRDVRGEMDIESVAGSIRVRGAPREVEIGTVSSSIDFIGEGELRRGDFQSVAGRIEVDADLSPNGRFEFETVSGSVILRVPSSVSADFEISSFSGNIISDFGGVARRSSPYLPAKELSLSVGGGGARVEIETLSGVIKLIER